MHNFREFSEFLDTIDGDSINEMVKLRAIQYMRVQEKKAAERLAEQEEAKEAAGDEQDTPAEGEP